MLTAVLLVRRRLKTVGDAMPRPASAKTFGRNGQGVGLPAGSSSMASMGSQTLPPSLTEIMNSEGPSRTGSGTSALPTALSDASLVRRRTAQCTAVACYDRIALTVFWPDPVQYCFAGLKPCYATELSWFLDQFLMIPAKRCWVFRALSTKW